MDFFLDGLGYGFLLLSGKLDVHLFLNPAQSFCHIDGAQGRHACLEARELFGNAQFREVQDPHPDFVLVLIIFSSAASFSRRSLTRAVGTLRASEAAWMQIGLRIAGMALVREFPENVLDAGVDACGIIGGHS